MTYIDDTKKRDLKINYFVPLFLGGLNNMRYPHSGKYFEYRIKISQTVKFTISFSGVKDLN